MESATIEQLIMGSCIKYKTLFQLISTSYAGSTCTKINLFIDLNSVLKKLYSIDKWGYKSKNKYDMTASIINMCGHYREFFRQIGVSTNIFLIYGLNCPSMNDTYVQGYNNKFIESYIKKKDVNELIESNLEILEMLCQYLPGIYFFNIGTNEVSAMIDYIINKLNPMANGIENIVLTKDVLALQLIPYYNVRVLRPYKTKNGDESFIVDNSNLWNMFCVNYRKCQVPEVLVPNTFFQNILAMTKVPERSIFSTNFTISKLFNIINASLRINFLDANKFYTQEAFNTILPQLDVPCNPTELDMRFRAINCRYQASYILLLEKPEFKYLRLVDLEDPKSVQEIATRYFVDTPLNLNYL